MRTQLNNNEKANELWNELVALPQRGAGKSSTKMVFVFAWRDCLAKDDQHFGDSFWQEIEDMRT